MKVRKVADVGNTKEFLTELGLLCLKDSLVGCSPEQIVTAGRTRDFRGIGGVGAKKAKLIVEALDKAGFILYERDETEPVRKFLWTIFGRHTDPILAKNNEAYERREELTDDDLRTVDLALDQYSHTFVWCRDGKTQTLTVRQSLEEFFVLFGEEPHSRPKIAARHNTIPSCVQSEHTKALSQLASPKNPFRSELQAILERIAGVKLHMLS